MKRTRTLVLAIPSLLALACGRDVIQHGDASSSTDASSGGGDASSTSAADSTGAPPVEIPGDGPYGAGTRLQPIVDRTADGVVQLVRWYDSELGIDCEFARDSVGDYRCLPAEEDQVYVGFDDEACSTPIVGTPYCSSVPNYVRGPIIDAASCADGARAQAYLRGAPIGSGDIRHHNDHADICNGSGSNFQQRHALTPIDDTTFVAATVVIEQRGSIEIRALVSTDGAFQRDRVIDPRYDTPCQGTLTFEAGAGTQACGVVSAAPYGFADATCTTPLFALPQDGTCAQPSTALIYGTDGWHTIGAPWEQTIHIVEGDACIEAPASVQDGFAYYELGAPTSEPEVLTLEVTLADASGRLRRLGLAGDGETIVLARGDGTRDQNRWYDTAIEQVCTPLIATDGRRRCMPLPLAYPNRLEHWGDPECSAIPLYDTAEAPEGDLVRITLVGEEACGGRPVIGQQNVVGRWTEPVYRLDDEGACLLDEVPDFITVFQLGNYPAISDAPELELTGDGS